MAPVPPAIGTGPSITTGLPTSGARTAADPWGAKPARRLLQTRSRYEPPRHERPLLSYATFRLALATMLTYQAPFAALVPFSALLARRVDGQSAAGASLAFAVFFIVSLGVRGAVVISPVRHRRIALVFAVVATAAGLAALSSGRGVDHLVVGMAVLGAPHGLTFPLAPASWPRACRPTSSVVPTPGSWPPPTWSPSLCPSPAAG